MDLLNLSRPWDCERFPKSKTICYAGGGGGGGGNPIKKISDTVSDATPTIKVDVSDTIEDVKKGGSKAIEDAKTGASSTIETVKKDASSGIEKKKTMISEGVEQVKKEGGKIIEDAKTQVGTETEKLKKGEFNLGDAVSGTASGIKKTFQESDIATGDLGTASDAVSENLQKVEKAVANSSLGKGDLGKSVTAAIENFKKEGTKATNQIKKEVHKLGAGQFSFKKAVQGTASGASKTFKESDAGKVTKKIAKETGYTGSDFDKTMQKVESETSNVINQTLDFVDSPGKVILSNVKKADQYIKERLGINVPTSQELLTQGILAVGKSLQPKGTPKGDPLSTTTSSGGPGGGRTIGQGSMEGLQGGGQLSASKRSRIRQNKRNLRIARA